MSAMPVIFLLRTSVETCSMIRSGPTMYGSSVMTMPLRRGLVCSMRAVARMRKVPRPPA